MIDFDAIDLGNLQAHDLADIWPMMDPAARGELRADIEMNGLAVKIVLLDGKILDGRNRYGELKAIGWAHDRNHYVDFHDLMAAMNSPMSPYDYVIALNERRRHMTDGQRAMAAVRATKKRPGQRNDIERLPIDTEPSANLRQVTPAEAAETFKVSERTLSSAFTVAERGVPELQELVDAGRVAVSVAEEIARMPAEDQSRAMSEVKPEQLKNVAKKYGRERRLQQLAAKETPLPFKKYMVIYADPEWKFLTRSENGMDRSADNHYPTSPLDVLMRRRVADIAADDCVLFMWATVPMLPEAFAVAHAWGFCLFGINGDGFLTIDKRKSRYVSNWEWVKTTIGNGYWGRNNHETLLIFTKGNPIAPAMGTQPNSAMHHPATSGGEDNWKPMFEGDVQSPLMTDAAGITLQPGEHSAKPWQFRDWIDRLFPDVPKIELNARTAAPGWDVWGNEAPVPVAGLSDAELSMASAVASKMTESDIAKVAASMPPPAKSSKAEIEERRAERRKREDAERTRKREMLMRSIGRDLPDDDAGLIIEYAKAIDAMDSALIAGDAKAAKAAKDRQWSVLFKVNDWKHFGVLATARGGQIRDAAMVRPNPHVNRPKFGQVGAFRISIDDPSMRAIVRFDRYSDDGLKADLSIYATSLDEEFCSETGYHSVMGVSCLGQGIADVAIAGLRHAIQYATDKKMNAYAKGLQMPARCHAIAPDGITVTVTKERKD